MGDGYERLRAADVRLTRVLEQIEALESDAIIEYDVPPDVVTALYKVEAVLREVQRSTRDQLDDRAGC
jgi:hypothetical protein